VIAVIAFITIDGMAGFISVPNPQACHDQTQDSAAKQNIYDMGY
jgi:hypothetical protein